MDRNSGAQCSGAVLGYVQEDMSYLGKLSPLQTNPEAQE